MASTSRCYSQEVQPSPGFFLSIKTECFSWEVRPCPGIFVATNTVFSTGSRTIYSYSSLDVPLPTNGLSAASRTPVPATGSSPLLLGVWLDATVNTPIHSIAGCNVALPSHEPCTAQMPITPKPYSPTPIHLICPYLLVVIKMPSARHPDSSVGKLCDLLPEVLERPCQDRPRDTKHFGKYGSMGKCFCLLHRIASDPCTLNISDNFKGI